MRTGTSLKWMDKSDHHVEIPSCHSMVSIVLTGKSNWRLSKEGRSGGKTDEGEKEGIDGEEGRERGRGKRDEVEARGTERRGMNGKKKGK